MSARTEIPGRLVRRMTNGAFAHSTSGRDTILFETENFGGQLFSVSDGGIYDKGVYPGGLINNIEVGIVMAQRGYNNQQLRNRVWQWNKLQSDTKAEVEGAQLWAKVGFDFELYRSVQDAIRNHSKD